MAQIKVNADKWIRKISKSPIGINVNFLMDGSFYKSPERTFKDALIDLGVKYLRYPGGDKSDNTLWSLPPYDKPQPVLAGYGEKVARREFMRFVEDDFRTFKKCVLGFDDFITICKEIDVEPIIVVPYDSMFLSPGPDCVIPTREELLRNAEEWVRYANIKKRYQIKYWEIGNESYIIAHHSGVRAVDYAKDIGEFSRRMKAVDPTICIMANGPTGAYPNESAISPVDKNDGEDTIWWQEVMAKSSEDIDIIAYHDYPCYAWGSYDHYAYNSVDLSKGVFYINNMLETYCSFEDQKRIRLMLTETNSADWSWNPELPKNKTWSLPGNLGHTLVLFDLIGENLKIENVDSILIWNTRWVNNDKGTGYEFWDSLDENNQLLSPGLAIKLWNDGLLDGLVEVEEIEGVSCFATSSASADLNVFIINKGYTTLNIELQIFGKTFKSEKNVKHWMLSGFGAEDPNPSLRQCPDLVMDKAEAMIISLPPVSLHQICFE